jgi:hypothetical protein
VCVEGSHNVENKNEKGKLKEYVRKLGLILKMELSTKNKMEHWNYLY